MVLVVKTLPANVGDTADLGLTPGSGRSPGGRNSNPLQCSCLEIPRTEEPGHKKSDITERLTLSLSRVDLKNHMKKGGRGMLITLYNDSC